MYHQIKKQNMYSPEWFREKANELQNHEEELAKFVRNFKNDFSQDVLEKLSGKELLDTIFINRDSKRNICNTLEFDPVSQEIFGKCGAVSVYKYGMTHHKSNREWVAGKAIKPEFLSEDEAVVIGTQIRDFLVAGANVISANMEIHTLEEYKKLYEKLRLATNGHIDDEWVLKYYAILYPEILTTLCNENIQNKVLDKIDIEHGDNLIYRSGQICEYARKCNVSNTMFGMVLMKYGDVDEEQIDIESIITYVESLADKYHLIGEIRPKDKKLCNYKNNGDGWDVFYTTVTKNKVNFFFKTKYLSNKLDNDERFRSVNQHFNRVFPVKQNNFVENKEFIKELLYYVSTVDSSKNSRTDNKHYNFIDKIESEEKPNPNEGDIAENNINPINSEIKLIESQEDNSLIDELSQVNMGEEKFEYSGVPKEKAEPICIDEHKTYPRDRQVAINALSHAGYVCEIDRNHPTFIRKKSNLNYTEPHHLVPMAYSDKFEVSLDTEANVVSLCSNCHNQIHYGKGADKLIRRLYEMRRDDLYKAGIQITCEELLAMY